MNVLSLRNRQGLTYLDGSWVAFDFETTNLDYGWAGNPANRIVMVSWVCGRGDKWDPRSVRSFYGNPLECAEFWQAIDGADFLVAQYCKFEASWLWRLLRDPTDSFWADPALFEWVLLGNNPRKLLLNLDDMGARYGLGRKDPFVKALIEGGVCPSEIPRSSLIRRCERDVLTTVGVFLQQLALLRDRKQLHLAALRCLMAPVLSDIEREGICLDRDRVLLAHAEYTAKYDELKRRLDTLTGGARERSPNEMIPFIYGVFPQVKDGKEWRPMTEAERFELCPEPLNFGEKCDRNGTPKRGAVSGAWPEGRPIMNKNVLEDLEEQVETDRQREWMDLRAEIGQAYAALSKNLDFFKGVVEERGGKFYAELMQGITATHRLSGHGRPLQFKQFEKPKSVQGQNMPREFKSFQVSGDPDYDISDADGKQLEFRGAVELSGDAKGLADILNPAFDAHLQTLTVMLNGVFSADVYADLLARYRAGDKEVKWQRNDNKLCKSHTYKPLFGGERGTKVQEAYYKWFRENYSGITEECGRWLKEVESCSELHTRTGFIFRYDVGWRERKKYLRGRQVGTEMVALNARTGKLLKPSVFNHPVQQFATGECIPIAVVCLYYRVKLTRIRARLTNTVHDSVSGKVHKEDGPQWCEAVRGAFTEDTDRWLSECYGIDLIVPLGCEVSLGDFLGEGRHFAYELERSKAA